MIERIWQLAYVREDRESDLEEISSSVRIPVSSSAVSSSTTLVSGDETERGLKSVDCEENWGRVIL